MLAANPLLCGSPCDPSVPVMLERYALINFFSNHVISCLPDTCLVRFSYTKHFDTHALWLSSVTTKTPIRNILVETFGWNFTFSPVGRICHQRWFASGRVIGLGRWPRFFSPENYCGNGRSLEDTSSNGCSIVMLVFGGVCIHRLL